jgi:argininosuccinate lyase
LLIAYLPNLEFDIDALKDASNPVIISGESAIEFLVARQVDRKKAEKAVEDLIHYCKERHKQPSDMTMNEWSQFSMAFDSGIYDAIANSEMEQASSHNSEYLHLDVRRKVMENIQSAHLLIEDDMTMLSAPDLHL